MLLALLMVVDEGYVLVFFFFMIYDCGFGVWSFLC